MHPCLLSGEPPPVREGHPCSRLNGANACVSCRNPGSARSLWAELPESREIGGHRPHIIGVPGAAGSLPTAGVLRGAWRGPRWAGVYSHGLHLLASALGRSRLRHEPRVLRVR